MIRAPMDWQQILALLVVGVAAFLLLRRFFRPRRPGLPCGQGCGCAGSPGVAPPAPVVYRARKAGSGRIRVRSG